MIDRIRSAGRSRELLHKKEDCSEDVRPNESRTSPNVPLLPYPYPYPSVLNEQTNSAKPVYDPGVNGRLLAEKKELMEEFPWWEAALDEATPSEGVRNRLKYQAAIWRGWVENPEEAPDKPAPPKPVVTPEERAKRVADYQALVQRRCDREQAEWALQQAEVARKEAEGFAQALIDFPNASFESGGVSH